MTEQHDPRLDDEDDFSHYFNATRRLSEENARLRSLLRALDPADPGHEALVGRVAEAIDAADKDPAMLDVFGFEEATRYYARASLAVLREEAPWPTSPTRG